MPNESLGNIFKLLPGHFYVRLHLLRHSVICATKYQHVSQCFHHILSFFCRFFSQQLLSHNGKTGHKISRKLHMFTYGQVAMCTMESFLIFMDDLDFSRSWPRKIAFWAIISQFLLVKLSPYSNRVCCVPWVGAFQYMKKHLEQFERETYVNVLRWPPLCKKTSLPITFELRHLGRQFWCLNLCFRGHVIRWCWLFWPMTLTKVMTFVKSYFGPYLGY